MEIRRGVHAQGVDELEVGHHYRLDEVPNRLEGLWWRWGTKDEGSPDSMLSPEQSEQVAFNLGPVIGDGS